VSDRLRSRWHARRERERQWSVEVAATNLLWPLVGGADDDKACAAAAAVDWANEQSVRGYITMSVVPGLEETSPRTIEKGLDALRLLAAGDPQRAAEVMDGHLFPFSSEWVDPRRFFIFAADVIVEHRRAVEQNRA
jgi:hypothetical protein